MSKHVLFRCVLIVAVPVLMIGGTAFGWGGNTHAKLCQITFDDPVVSPLLGGIDQSTIENFIGEPGTYQNGQWDNIAARAYIDTGVSPNGLNWQGLSETDRLKYMQHNTTDVGVPIGHSPACINPGGFTDTGKEAYLEAQVATWTSWPSVVGTCNFTNSKTGHSYNFTGTYDQIISTFYNACRDNMTWSKSNLAGFPYFQDYNDYRAAGWNGTTIGLMLQRATFVDYFLAKLPTVADIDTPSFVLSPGDSARFDGRECYDPDAVSWNSNGTYSQTYATLSEYCWDFNNDGTWDLVDHDPYVDRTYEQLIAIGVPTDTWVNYQLRVKDNEGKYAYEESWLWLHSSGGVPEPATLSLLVVGGLALLRRRR